MYSINTFLPQETIQGEKAKNIIANWFNMFGHELGYISRRQNKQIKGLCLGNTPSKCTANSHFYRINSRMYVTEWNTVYTPSLHAEG